MRVSPADEHRTPGPNLPHHVPRIRGDGHKRKAGTNIFGRACLRHLAPGLHRLRRASEDHGPMRRVELPSGEIRRFARHTDSLEKLKRYGKTAQRFTGGIKKRESTSAN